MRKKYGKDYPRINDRVRIDNPLFFVRCGYPLTLDEVKNQIKKDYCLEIKKM